jgi:hypothetical protein
MAERGIRWIRLALYFAGALGLTALALVFGIGRGKPAKHRAANLPDAGQSAKPDTLAAKEPTDKPPPTTGTPEGKRRSHLRPQVRKPKDPPSWDSFDNSDMNLE